MADMLVRQARIMARNHSPGDDRAIRVLTRFAELLDIPIQSSFLAQLLHNAREQQGAQ